MLFLSSKLLNKMNFIAEPKRVERIEQEIKKIGIRFTMDPAKTEYSSKETGYKIVYIYEKLLAENEKIEDRPEKGTPKYWKWACQHNLVIGYDINGTKQVEVFTLILESEK